VKGVECIHCKSVVHNQCQNQVKSTCKSSSNTRTIQLPDTYSLRGLTQYHMGHYNEAIADFNIAIDMANQNPKYFSQEKLNTYIANRGLAEFYINDHKACIKDLTYAIDNGFTNAQVYAMRSSAYQLLGDEKAAMEDRRMAHKLDSRVAEDVFPYPLPNDIIVSIFSSLPENDRKSCQLACRSWRKLISDAFNFRRALEMIAFDEKARIWGPNILSHISTVGKSQVVLYESDNRVTDYKDMDIIKRMDCCLSDIGPNLCEYSFRKSDEGTYWYDTDVGVIVIDSIGTKEHIRFSKIVVFVRTNLDESIRLFIHESFDKVPSTNDKDWKMILDWRDIKTFPELPPPLMMGNEGSLIEGNVMDVDFRTRFIKVEVRCLNSKNFAITLIKGF